MHSSSAVRGMKEFSGVTNSSRQQYVWLEMTAYAPHMFFRCVSTLHICHWGGVLRMLHIPLRFVSSISFFIGEKMAYSHKARQRQTVSCPHGPMCCRRRGPRLPRAHDSTSARRKRSGGFPARASHRGSAAVRTACQLCCTWTLGM